MPLLEQRFGQLPNVVVDRIRAATPEDLSRWSSRLLDANTLRDVLD